MLQGHTFDKHGNALGGVTIEIKDEQFQTIYSAVSADDGSFCVEAPDGVYPFVAAVKEYGQNYLEYWCQNVDTASDAALEIRIDKLELYGLHVFRVKGGLDAYMIYFRPMSLTKFQNGETDICPDIAEIHVSVNGKPAALLVKNTVKESVGDMEMTAYLLHVGNPETKEGRIKVEVSIRDTEGNCGAASIFCES